MPRAPAAKKSPRQTGKSSRDKVRAFRARQRRKGLRLVQMWLPDTRSAAFKREAHRQSLAIAQSPSEKDDQAFIDSLMDWDNLEAR